MNRLHHIRKTLPKNIEDNIDYPNVEFVLLDYGSEDGLEKWVISNMQGELQNGILNFKRTNKPKKYLSSHSKNMAHRQSTGDIVCNLDGDNFTGPGFAEYLNQHFQNFPDSFLSVDYNNNWNEKSDTFGRIVCWKKGFERIGGDDEKMIWYSYDDIDFCERLRKSGTDQHFISNQEFLKTIQHGDEERVSKNAASEISEIYIQYIDPLTSRLIFIFRNGSFCKGTLMDINMGFGNPVIQEKQWITGKVTRQKDRITLVNSIGVEEIFNHDGVNLKDEQNNTYYLITDSGFKHKLGMDYAIISNHQVLVNNLEEKRITANRGNP
jgi:hypothetical protein